MLLILGWKVCVAAREIVVLVCAGPVDLLVSTAQQGCSSRRGGKGFPKKISGEQGVEVLGGLPSR